MKYILWMSGWHLSLGIDVAVDCALHESSLGIYRSQSEVVVITVLLASRNVKLHVFDLHAKSICC